MLVAVLASSAAIGADAQAVPFSGAGPEPAHAAAARSGCPRPGTSWQWQIVGRIDRLRGVDMYDVDLQDAVPSPRIVRVRGFGSARWPRGVNAGIVKRLHSRDKVAICYLDTGAWERYRPDAKLFPRSVIGRSTGWSGRTLARHPALCLAAVRADHLGPPATGPLDRCDGLEPDENNPLGNHPGFAIPQAGRSAAGT